MIPLVGIVFLVAWLYNHREPPSAVAYAVTNSATMEPHEIDAAAKEAQAAGLPKTATILRQKADVAREFQGGSSPTAAIPSPLAGVSDPAWRNFVEWAKRGTLAMITAKYLLGFFLMNARTLGDLGMMRNVQRVKHPDRGWMWVGEWVAPFSQANFLSNPRLQYVAFKRAATILYRYVREKGWVGKVAIDGVPATMSGLMAVANVAGMGGLAKWIEDPKKRKPETTKAFTDANGIF